MFTPQNLDIHREPWCLSRGKCLHWIYQSCLTKRTPIPEISAVAPAWRNWLWGLKIIWQHVNNETLPIGFVHSHLMMFVGCFFSRRFLNVSSLSVCESQGFTCRFEDWLHQGHLGCILIRLGGKGNKTPWFHKRDKQSKQSLESCYLSLPKKLMNHIAKPWPFPTDIRLQIWEHDINVRHGRFFPNGNQDLRLRKTNIPTVVTSHHSPRWDDLGCGWSNRVTWDVLLVNG